MLIVLLAMHERRVRDPLLPPRLFANGVILRGVMIGFFAALAMFSGTFMLPLFFQLVRGADASGSGSAGGAVPGLDRRRGLRGRAACPALRKGQADPARRAWPAACSASCCSARRGRHGGGAGVLYQIVLGAGIGLVMPSSLVMVQNAAERRDVGVATGCLLFLRSMGGASAAPSAGALLANRFASDAARYGPQAEHRHRRGPGTRLHPERPDAGRCGRPCKRVSPAPSISPFSPAASWSRSRSSWRWERGICRCGLSRGASRRRSPTDPGPLP